MVQICYVWVETWLLFWSYFFVCHLPSSILCTSIPLSIAAHALVAVCGCVCCSFDVLPRMTACLSVCRKPVLLAYHHYSWWSLTTQNGNLFPPSLSLSFTIFSYFLLPQSQLKHWGVTGWEEGRWCWEEVEWRNGNGMGKMGMEDGAGGGRTKVVGWFMVLDLGGMG